MNKDEKREEFLRKYTNNANLVLSILNEEKEKKAEENEKDKEENKDER